MTTLRRAALIVSAICGVIWLAAPVALLAMSSEVAAAPVMAAIMLSLWILALIGMMRRNVTMVTWAAGLRGVLDPMSMILISDLSFAWSCALFLADAAALLIALEAMPWTKRAGQGREGPSDGILVRSFLLSIGKPALAGVVALVASLAVAMVAYLLDIGSSPLLVIAGAGVAAVISLAALLAWTSKTL